MSGREAGSGGLIAVMLRPDLSSNYYTRRIKQALFILFLTFEQQSLPNRYVVSHVVIQASRHIMDTQGGDCI